jgi:hypothetical protein
LKYQHRYHRDAVAAAITEPRSPSRDHRAAITEPRSPSRDHRAAITEPWSNGRTDGQIIKLKLVKRQMRGCARLGFLRASPHEFPTEPR